ncbi:MAG TPA: hypothetical protein VFG94_00150, partial [Acidimicrobiales bacterium]|nr:hypothetical protein [Acidimicrobiales bacterium]
WLARQAAAGRVPEPEGDDPVRDLTATSSLVLAQVAATADRDGCPPLTGPLTLTLRSGDEIGFAGMINVTATDDAHKGSPTRLMSQEGSVIRAQAGPVDVVVRQGLGQRARLCAPRMAGS